MNNRIQTDIEKIESVYINYHNVNIITNKLNEVISLSKSTADPECVLITGDSGSGKTSFVRQFLSHYSVVLGNEVDIHPVIYAEIPSQANIKDLAIVLLKALNDPY